MGANLSFTFTNRSDKAMSETGWIVFSIQTVDTLEGDDSIIGNGDERGININGGTINTDDGNDKIIGIGFSSGVFNYGTINTGAGNDKIIGKGGSVGILIDTEYAGTINTGAGNDKITGEGAITGIYNKGIIKTGTGNDIIIGKNSIQNEGTIDTGAGNDLVNALAGGFRNNGKINLGRGSDKLMGFGSGQFYGGTGEDIILFGEGTYIINDSIIAAQYTSMNVNGFEQIGGASGGLFAFKDGTLTVDAAGVGTFA